MRARCRDFSIDLCALANAVSPPPEKYGRKAKTQRNRRGPTQAVEHGVQFDGKRSTSPRLDISEIRQKRWSAARNPKTGDARSSSARALRCTVQSANERNPHPLLFFQGRLPPPRRRKVGMTSDQRVLYCLGLHPCYNGRYRGQRTRKGEPIPSKSFSVRIVGCNSPA